MNQKLTATEKFILWFLRLDEIDFDSRRNLARHLQKTGKLDEKSAKFIDEAVRHLLLKNHKKAVELQNRYKMIQAQIEAEENPETSFRWKIARKVGNYMKKCATGFKIGFREYESRKNRSEESEQSTVEQQKVAELKAMLAT